MVLGVAIEARRLEMDTTVETRGWSSTERAQHPDDNSLQPRNFLKFGFSLGLLVFRCVYIHTLCFVSTVTFDANCKVIEIIHKLGPRNSCLHE